MSNNDNNEDNGNNQSSDSNDDNVFMESATDYAIIREIYDGAHEVFESELERALDMGCETIVIEPQRLGEEIGRWITFGNCLESTSIITGVGSILTGIVWQDKPITQCSLAAISVLLNAIHKFSWRLDPCSNYVVQTDPKLISMHSVHTVSSQPVVLIRRNSSEMQRNQLIEVAISLIAFAFSAFKFYKSFKFTIA